ncbi:MAG: CinA family protein [Bacilli bacterium]|nr:CinA family protein [Bacilli bacterium]
MEARDIKELFVNNNKTLGSIESFTGGLFASEITKVPGASKFYKGGVVSYATEEKIKVVKVNKGIVDKYGVVSQECAKEMATKGRQLLNVDYCISFTGNAGPDAMENKPVGEVYIGLASEKETIVIKKNLTGNRENIQKEAIKIAYEILEKNFQKK